MMGQEYPVPRGRSFVGWLSAQRETRHGRRLELLGVATLYPTYAVRHSSPITHHSSLITHHNHGMLRKRHVAANYLLPQEWLTMASPEPNTENAPEIDLKEVAKLIEALEQDL